MNCGFVLADKWLHYQKRVQELRGNKSEPEYIDGSALPDKKTPEFIAAEECGVTRYCCRKVLLTHRDLLHKI